ncbi:hypothetical protein [Oceanobacillus jeddahense]|uniref:Uncharacterized protein n=1 Tax=Oceanobacillus jeddahense TaxID=1462527 RepID=A0ABY5JQQ5_9BACI|nr:hypothetical protein [Oceanobacillus jeddahense]UUI02125.1 hypothetical protein NP439_19085 [Oceanobacillus jeddahense]
MKKIIIPSVIVVFIILSAIFSSDFFEEEKEEDDRLSEILEYANENYDLSASTGGRTQGENDGILFFEINRDTINIEAFHSDIVDKMDQYDLTDKYDLEIKQTSTEEARLERLERNIDSIIRDYLSENDMDDNITFDTNIDQNNPSVTFNIREASNVDKEELEEIMNQFINVEINTGE